MSVTKGAVRQGEISDPTETDRVNAERELFAAYARETWAQLSAEEKTERFQSAFDTNFAFWKKAVRELMRAQVVMELWHEWNAMQVIARGEATVDDAGDSWVSDRAVGREIGFHDLDRAIDEGEMNDLISNVRLDPAVLFAKSLRGASGGRAATVSASVEQNSGGTKN